MRTARIDGNRCLRTGMPRTPAAIVFGSAAAAPAAKPASVRATCEAIGLARSTYYYQSHRSTTAIELEHKIVLRLHELRAGFPNDGYRRMTQQLQQEGFRVNRKRIARLMQLHGLTLRSPKCSGSMTRYGRPASTVANLWQTVRLTRPHQVWVADIAYVRIRSSLVYAAAIIDAWSGEVVGYAVSPQINPRLASIALHAAVRAHRPAPGSVHHSTSGTQYVMRGYTELLRQYGLIPSAGDTADPSGIGPIRCETRAPSRQVVDMQSYETWEQVIDQVREFILTLYSPERIDWVLGRRPPAAAATVAVPATVSAAADRPSPAPVYSFEVS
jgi:putative transposase